MKITRRAAVAALLVGLAITSGCVGVLTGEEPLEFGASPATVDDAAQSDTGYEEKRVEELIVNETFEAGGQSRTVEVTNWVGEYQKSIDMGPLGEQRAAAFAVVATPKVEIAGQTFNPVGDMDDRELAEQFTSEYDDLNDVRKVDSRNVTTLGTETTVTKFAATTRMGGQEIDLYLHVTRIEHGDDFVIALGVYPQEFDDREADDVRTLITSIEHEA